MEKRKVIDGSNLPTKLPISGTLFAYLCLDYWKAPEWLFGAVGVIYIFLWGAAIYYIATQKRIDIFKDAIDLGILPSDLKSKFSQKMDEALKKRQQ